MKKIILFTSFLISSLYYFCQDNNVTYSKYELSGTGYIYIPSILEVQSEDYKKKAESLQKAIGNIITEDRVVFQLKGINNELNSTKPSYEKIIIKTEKGYYGEYKKSTSKDFATKQELLDFGSSYKDYLVNNSNYGTLYKLISYDGASNVVINGQNAIKISYLRQALNNEPSYTDIYFFQNNDRVYILTICYRKSKANIWKPVFEKVLNSFKITNVR